MASIITSEVIRDDEQANGFRYVEYRYTIEDNNLDQVTVDYGPLYVPSLFNTATDIVTRGSLVLDGLEEAEIVGVFFLARAEESEIENLAALQAQINSLVENPIYTITKRLQKKLIYYLMRRADSQYALNVKTVYDNLPATDVGIKNRLDITQAQLNRLRAKVAEFYAPPASAKSGEEIILGSFKTESEDWEE